MNHMLRPTQAQTRDLETHADRLVLILSDMPSAVLVGAVAQAVGQVSRQRNAITPTDMMSLGNRLCRLADDMERESR